MMAILVIDYQASLPGILKEVAIVDITSNMEQYYIAEPHVELHTYSSSFQRTADYAFKHIHGIPWSAGNIPLADVEFALRRAIDNAKLVYIKGFDRVKFLLGLTGCPTEKIIDLDEFPDITKTTQRRKFYRCYYDHPRHNNLRCALEQATRYRDYLRNNYYYCYTRDY